MCLGHALAGIQMYIILAEMLTNFSFSLISNKEPAINASVVIKAAKPLKLKVTTI